MEQGANSSVSLVSYITKEVLEDEEYEEPLHAAALREAYLQTLAREYYPYIPEVYGVKGNVIKMEHIVGGQRLNKYLELNPKDINIIRDQVIQIIQALGSALIRHRDVTYENLMVDNQGRLWLIDFGRAQRISSEDVDASFEHDLAIYDDTIQDYFSM